MTKEDAREEKKGSIEKNHGEEVERKGKKEIEVEEGKYWKNM